MPTIVFFFFSQTSFGNHIDTIEKLYKKYGNEYYLLDEKITQEAHALQAAFIAHKAGAPEDVVIALLFHDIGQITSLNLVGHTHELHEKHDDIGAEWLKIRNFPSFVRDFARYHTMVKVLLCEQDETYFSHLSKASQDSYLIQKRKLDEPAYAKNKSYLLNHPRLNDLKYARYIDDLAKISDIFSEDLPGFGFYQKMLNRVINNHFNNGTSDWKQTIQTWRNIVKINPQIFSDQLRNLANLET